MTGLFVEGNFEDLISSIKREKKINLIVLICLAILKVVFMYYVAKYCLSLMELIESGDETIGILISELGFAGVLYCIAKVIEISIEKLCLKKKNFIYANKYMNVIRVFNKEVLFDVLNSMELKCIRGIYYDEFHNICVQGRAGQYCFRINGTKVGIYPSKKSYRTSVECNQIAGNLLVKIDEDAPINTYEKEHKWHYFTGRRLGWIIGAVVSMFIWILPEVFPSLAISKNSYIEMVKNSNPVLYPNDTYGNAFEYYFYDGKWNCFTSEDLQTVVQFSGKYYNSLGEEKTADIQFLVTEKENHSGYYNIETYSIAIDGIEQNNLMSMLLITDIFENFDSSGI